MLTLIFCSRQCVCVFTAFFRRYVKSMQWTQIASIPKVLLALTRLLFQVPSEKSMILASGTERRLLRQSSRVFLHATIMLLLSHTRRPGLIRRKPRLARVGVPPPPGVHPIRSARITMHVTTRRLDKSVIVGSYFKMKARAMHTRSNNDNTGPRQNIVRSFRKST